MKAKSIGQTKPVQEFAVTFAYDDWSYLCAQADFLKAVESQDFVGARQLAHQYLSRKAQQDHKKHL